MSDRGLPVDLNRVDLNLLVAFDALMAERSVTAAATRLSVGQSAMSSTLARLRKLFDDPILVREGQTMVATPAAESLAAPVHEALNRIRTLLAGRNRFDPAVDERTFTVMTSDYSAVAALHPLLVHLTAEAPHIRLHIQPVEQNFPERLARNQVDLLIAPKQLFPGYATYCYESLYHDRYVLAVDSANPEIGETVSVEDFSRLPYLATHYGGAPSLVEAQLDALGIARRVDVTTGFAMAPFFLRGTRLVTLIPLLWGRRLAAAAGLRLLEPPMPLPYVTETIFWTERHEDDPAHRWLRERLREVAGAFADEASHTPLPLPSTRSPVDGPDTAH
jgi:DNA-binding transcriptional LysR family regulator